MEELIQDRRPHYMFHHPRLSRTDNIHLYTPRQKKRHPNTPSFLLHGHTHPPSISILHFTSYPTEYAALSLTDQPTGPFRSRFPHDSPLPPKHNHHFLHTYLPKVATQIYIRLLSLQSLPLLERHAPISPLSLRQSPFLRYVSQPTPPRSCTTPAEPSNTPCITLHRGFNNTPSNNRASLYCDTVPWSVSVQQHSGSE